MTTNENRERLAAFTAACLSDAATRANPANFLDLNADHVELQLRALSAWADRGGECPAHLRGLMAFDLSEAMDTLRAAANRWRRAAA